MYSKLARGIITAWMYSSLLYCSQVSTDVQPLPFGSSCILLGPTPSFIIKLHHYPSRFLAREQLTEEILGDIAIPEITFTQGKSMSQGYYVVHFKPTKQAMTLYPDNYPSSGCYSHKALSKMMSKIKQSHLVAEVTPNFLSSVMEMSQSDIPVQWNLQIPPGGIDAEAAWVNFTTGAPHITIAVLDTGIMNHAALNPNILPGVHFINAGDSGVSATPSCIECAGYDHGTIVAGIIASTGESVYGEPLFGVAPRSTILPINVFTKFTDQKTCGFPPCLYSYLSDQINALYWLAGDVFSNLTLPPTKIVGINMSLGNIAPCPAAAQAVLNQMQNKELLVVVAAGNQNNDASRDYPANCNNVISVAATGLYGERASYSNWGRSVTIAAPGGNGQYSILSTTHDAYIYKQGTSLAAPHVSGVIALLYAIDPILGTEKIKKIITSQEAITSFPSLEMLPTGSISCIDALSPEKSCGVGIINAYKAAQKTYALLSEH